MAMITQCPACGTAFRVTPPQLQAQRGNVRCGHCAHVFDGFKSLSVLRDDQTATATQPVTPAAPTPVSNVSSPSPPSPIESVVQPAVASDTPVVEPPFSETTPPPPQVAPTIIEPPPPPPPIAVETPVASAARPAEVDVPPLPFGTDYDSQLEMQSMLDHALDTPDVPLWRRVTLGLGIALLFFTLAAQAAYFYRGQIAANVPELRPQLNEVCGFLHCKVALPQLPRQINIEASDMQAIDPSNPGLITLMATLRNQAPTTLGYPALDVVLTDAQDHTVARRIFYPTEYLEPDKDLSAGMPPDVEVNIKLDIDSGDLGAAGFRLDLLAAPTR